MAKGQLKPPTKSQMRAEMAKVSVKPEDRVPVKTLTDEQIQEALIETGGDVTRAAGVLQCERTQLHRRVLASEELKALREAAIERQNVDLVGDARWVVKQSLAGQKMERSQYTMAIFVMKTIGGWVEKREVSGPQGGPIGIVVAPVRNLGPEDWKAQNQVQPDSHQIPAGKSDINEDSQEEDDEQVD